MDFEMDKKYWTNFDLLDAVKRVSAQNSLSYSKQQYKIVAEEILHELGELSIHSSQSDEDRELISKFSKKYFRVVSKFKPYRNNFERPDIQTYGNEIFWTLKEKNISNDTEENMSSQDSGTSQEVNQATMKSSRNIKSLVDLTFGSTQMSARLKPIIEDIKKHASTNEIEVTRLLGLLIHKINYSATGVGSKAKAAIGLSLFEDNIPETEFSADKALSLLTKYKFGKRQYTNLRLDLKPYLLLPTYNHIKECKDLLLPRLDILPQSLVGIKYLYKEALIAHFSRFFIAHPELNSTNYKAVIKDGCDGSGRHSLYNQHGNVNVHNIFSYMFVVLELYEYKESPNSSQSQYVLVYSEPLPNSSDAARPIALVMGKENLETLGELIPVIQSEISEILEDGLCLSIDIRVMNIEVEMKSSMTDGRVKILLTGRGGAYCIVSDCTRENGNISQKYCDGFPMKGVSLPELWSMFSSIEKDGKIPKRIPTKDRLGLTNKPLLSSTNIDYLPVLHVLLRVFDWSLKVVYHRNAKLSSWIETAKDQDILNDSKKEVKGKIEIKTGIRVDQPDPAGAGGNTNNGNTVRRLFWIKENRDFLAECAPEEDQELLKSIFRYLAIILRLISSDHKINVDKLDFICKDTATMILDSFNGSIKIPNTLHVLLAHACALIEANGGYGFKKLSEEPLESNNKYVRQFREQLARKTNQVENLTDVVTRLWIKSDPIVRSIKRELYCKLCEKKSDHTTRSSQCPQQLLYSPRQSDDVFFN